jgi:hypothetical protein
MFHVWGSPAAHDQRDNGWSANKPAPAANSCRRENLLGLVDERGVRDIMRNTPWCCAFPHEKPQRVALVIVREAILFRQASAPEQLPSKSS